MKFRCKDCDTILDDFVDGIITYCKCGKNYVDTRNWLFLGYSRELEELKNEAD